MHLLVFINCFVIYLEKATHPKENSSRRNRKNLHAASEGSHAKDLSRIPVYCKRSRGSISFKEQYNRKELKAASIGEDNHKNNIYEKTTIDKQRTSQINAARKETNIASSQELHNKKEIVSNKILKNKDPSAKTLDGKDVSSESQSSIDRRKGVSNYQLEEKNDSFSMTLRSRNLTLKTKKIENESSTNQDQNEGISCLNKDNFSQIPRRSSRLLKTIDIPGNFSSSQINIGSSKKSINLKRQVKNGTLSMSLRSQDYSKNNITRLGKKEGQIVKKTINTGCNFSDIPRKVTRSSSRNIRNSRSDCEKYVVPAGLKKRENPNCNNFYAEKIDSEELSTFHASIASTSEKVPSSQENENNYVFPNLRKLEKQNSKDHQNKTVESEEDLQASPTENGASGNALYCQDNVKKYIEPQSLKKRNIINLKDFYVGSIDNGKEFAANQYFVASSASDDIHQENDKKDIVPTSLRMEENKNWKDFHEGLIQSKQDSAFLQTIVPENIHNDQDNGKKDTVPYLKNSDDKSYIDVHEDAIHTLNHFPASQTDIAKSSAENICNGKKHIDHSNLWNYDGKMYCRDFYGETDRNSLDTHPNIKRSSIVNIYNDQEVCKINILLPNAKQEDIKHNRGPHRKIICIGYNSPVIQTNEKTEQNIDSCQELYNNNLAPSSMQRQNNIDFLRVKNTAYNLPSNTASNIIVRLKNLSKEEREVCWDHQDISVDYKDIQNNSLAIQSNALRGKDTDYNGQKEYDRKVVSRSLNNSLVEELESSSIADSNCCKSTTKTDVLFKQESFKSENICFDTKESIYNFNVEDLSFPISKRTDMISKSKAVCVFNWYHMEEQGKAGCSDQISGNFIQPKVIYYFFNYFFIYKKHYHPNLD